MSATRPDSTARALDTLEHLLELPGADLAVALTQASNRVAESLKADKIDVFLYQPEKESLVAVGSSTQPLSALQKRLGLDVMAIANGGRVVEVFRTGQPFMSGRLEEDPDELRGIKESLAIRSQAAVPLLVGGARKGVLLAASQSPDFFTPDDLRFLGSVVRWVGMVAHRADLVEEIARAAAAQGRQAAAEELVTVLAHDLRNLIAPVAARLQLIQTRAAKDRRTADLRDAESASEVLQRLAQMVTDILDVARIDQGIFRIDAIPLDVGPLAEEVGKTLSRPGQPVQIQGTEEAIVSGDPTRLRQCLENIVANAVQHSPRGAPVTILVTRQKHEDGIWARLEVVDEGPGIPADILPRIFERWSSGKVSGGLGLGLYLARRIVDAHGGRLRAETGPQKGARFIIELPCLEERT